MKKKLIFISLILICTAGCAGVAPKQPPVVHTPAEKEGIRLTIPVSQVEKRIQFLEKFLKTDNLSDNAGTMALALLNVYRLLKRTAGAPITDKTCETLTHSLFNSMSLMEKTYFETINKATDDENPLAVFIRERNEIMNLYRSGNYKGVIHRCLALETNFPEALTPEIGIVFALALAEDGMLEEAIEIGSRIAEALEHAPDIVQLRGEIARWQLALGQKAQAVSTLEKITHTQDNRATLTYDLKNRIDRVPEPDQPGFISVFQPPEAAADQNTPPQMAPLQEKIDMLVQNHEFSEAKRLLLKEKTEKEEGPETEIIDRALKNVEEMETAYEENVKVKEDYLKQTYEAAIRLYEKENYKGVVDKLREMERTGVSDVASTNLKNRAIESLINLERNRAAELFLEAKKTNDPKKKRELLETSYKILKTLLEDYPESPLAPKLTSHITIVQGEIEKLR